MGSSYGLPTPTSASRRHPLLPPRLRLPLALFSLFLLSAGYLLGRSSSSSSLSRSFHIPNSRIPFAIPEKRIPRLQVQAVDTVDGGKIRVPEAQWPRRIPNVVHYIHGLAGPEDPPELKYFQYLAIRSALVTLKPDLVLFHYRTEPVGYWWAQIRPHVTLVRARDVHEVYGRPVEKFAHKADVVRLEALLKWGGIYLDVDTFVVRDFASAGLLEEQVVLGMEAATDPARTELEPSGLCNAVILAERNARFLRDWLHSYETFDKNEWASHSVTMPWTLAQRDPTSVTVLNNKAFFWPLWTSEHLDLVHESTTYDFFGTDQFAYHAWESLARPWLDTLDPTTLRTRDSSFARMARRFAEKGEEERWVAWKEGRNV